MPQAGQSSGVPILFHLHASSSLRIGGSGLHKAFYRLQREEFTPYRGPLLRLRNEADLDLARAERQTNTRSWKNARRTTALAIATAEPADELRLQVLHDT